MNAALKILLALAALLAAAICALLFPDMKRLLILIPFALLAILLSSGCTSIKRALRQLPDGHFEKLVMNETGKFSNTTGTFAVLDKDNDVIRARGVDLRHSNLWIPNLSLQSEVVTIDLATTAGKRVNPTPIALPDPSAP